MSFQPIADWATAILVLLGVFLLFYSAIRQQGIKETVLEIKELLQDKTESIRDGGLKYA